MKRILKYALGLVLLILLGVLVLGTGRALVWLGTRDAQPGLSGPPQVFAWAPDLPGTGGYSSLIISQTGAKVLIASDRGHFISGDLRRDALGQIMAIDAPVMVPLLLNSNAPTDQFLKDLEGMAPLPDGTIALSFESYTRLQIMQPITGPAMQVPRRLHPWDRFAPLFHNFAFEAITALPASHAPSRILTLIEYGPTPGTTDAYTYDGTQWIGPQPFAHTPGFQISGADLGPDGCLYILERHYGVFTGFQFQLSRRAPDDWTSAGTLLYRSKPMSLGNGEGVSIWEHNGQMIASIVTDNGFPPFSPTRLIELRVAPHQRPAHGCVDQ